MHWSWKVRKLLTTYRVSLKKGTFSIFVLFLLKKSDLTFHMCFRIRISIPFQLVAKITSTQNPNCSKNAESTCANRLFIPALRCEAWAVASLHNSRYLTTLDYQNITGVQSKHLMKMEDNIAIWMWIAECIPHSWNSTFIEKLSTFMKDHKTSCLRMRLL